MMQMLDDLIFKQHIFASLFIKQLTMKAANRIIGKSRDTEKLETIFALCEHRISLRPAVVLSEHLLKITHSCNFQRIPPNQQFFHANIQCFQTCV